MAAIGCTSLLGPMRPGQPRRNRLQASLKGEDMLALLCRLDRDVAGETITLQGLEATVASDLMLPHVLDTLMGFGFITVSGPLTAVSSTNVRMLHGVYRKLGMAPASRATWHTAVCEELVGIVERTTPQSAGDAQFLREVRMRLSPLSVAWNICKVGTVLGVALGGATKLRAGKSSPVKVCPAVRRAAGTSTG